jgi:hypothetical protein
VGFSATTHLMMLLMLAVQLSLRWLATLSVAANWTCSNSSSRTLLEEKVLKRDILTTCTLGVPAQGLHAGPTLQHSMLPRGCRHPGCHSRNTLHIRFQTFN